MRVLLLDTAPWHSDYAVGRSASEVAHFAGSPARRRAFRIGIIARVGNAAHVPAAGSDPSWIRQGARVDASVVLADVVVGYPIVIGGWWWPGVDSGRPPRRPPGLGLSAGRLSIADDDVLRGRVLARRERDRKGQRPTGTGGVVMAGW